MNKPKCQKTRRFFSGQRNCHTKYCNFTLKPWKSLRNIRSLFCKIKLWIFRNDLRKLRKLLRNIRNFLCMIKKSTFIKVSIWNCYENYVIMCELIRNPEYFFHSAGGNYLDLGGHLASAVIHSCMYCSRRLWGCYA